MLTILSSQTALPPGFPHFLLLPQSHPVPLYSLSDDLYSCSLLSAAPNPNSECWETSFHCPYPCLLLQADLGSQKESGGSRRLGPQPQSASNQPFPGASARPVSIPGLQLWAFCLPGWALPFSLGPGRTCWGCVRGEHEENRQEDVQRGPARDFWHSKRGACVPGSAPSCSLPETGSVWGWLPCLAP